VAELLTDPDNPWWDDRRTPAVEHRDDLLNAALEQALGQTIAERGDPDGGGWRWDRVRHANIYHLLRIPAFSRLDLAVQGGPSTLSPSSGTGTDGASWRMVVQLGPEVHGWGTYPGGQSGNPVSRRYAEHLDQWLAGELDSLRFPRRPEELAGDDASASLMLEPAR
jgi:penicillin amidase